ncbi:unnamed protein product [marine sediment metagenome]|uniref:UDP-N-acetylglucosamine kinase n=1 Tax=marine sediment metagenome TaxID=412755 RepID=X0Z6U8_9ZZZZ
MIIDIRGSHGSGKSHIVHSILHNKVQHSILRDDLLVGIFVPELSLAILGDYSVNCGGCDQIRTADEICQRVREFAGMKEVKHVLLEGILVAHTFQRYSDLANEMDEYVFCFIEVPLVECVRRVRARRVERGKKPDFDLFHITADHKRIHQRLPTKFIEAGHRVVYIDGSTGDAGTRRILELLNE